MVTNSMDAFPYLARIAELLERHGLEAVMIGNAAAALRGVPVTTVDIDFLFRKTRTNVAKLKRITDDLDATLMQPYYPTSSLFRISRDLDGLQLDFMSSASGINSFEGLRKRASAIRMGSANLTVASLADIIKSKRAAGRPQDIAVLGVMEETLEEAARHAQNEAGSAEKGK